jgi:lysophospholipase L1-like esterase
MNKSTDTFRYLALGDSYTIGEAVTASENFPAQLVQAISHADRWKNPEFRIIATTGWTTDELLNAIEKENPDNGFQLVSLLIGVNNQYRGYPRDQYSREFRQLLEKAIHFAGGNAGRVFVVSIPDYGCTPFGADKADEIYADLIWYNGEAQKIASEYSVRFCDAFDISRRAASEPALTAPDQLHPSGEMYRRWVERMLPVALACLEAEE